MTRMKKQLLSSLGVLICISLAVPAAPEEMPFGATQAVDNASLDKMRGGIKLPNGLDLSIGIDIQTRVNGALVLHTVFSSDSSQITVTQNFSNAISSTGTPTDEAHLPVQANNAAINTPFGTVSQKTSSQGTIVSLKNTSLSVEHLIGQTNGTIVANTANNQAIDTITNININLKGISPVITNNLFSINEIAARAGVRPQL